MSQAARRTVGICAAALTAIVVLSRLWFLVHRRFDVDEFEHAHAAWAVSRGMVPYLDFFEHHTPWFYLLFAPLVARFPTDVSPASAVDLLLTWRLVMWVMTAASVALVYALGTEWRDRFTGVLAAAFVVTGDEFLDTMLEIRPDVPALVCFLAGLWAAVRAHRSDGAREAGRWFLGSGLLFGAALMFTQKYAFAAPGLAFVLLAYTLDGRDAAARAARARAAGLFVIGALVPLVATAAWFAWRGALGPFIFYNGAANFTFNRTRFSSAEKLGSIGIKNPALFALGLAGFAAAAWRHVGGRGRPGERVLLFTAASLLVGLFIMPVPFAQFFLMFLPHLAVFQAEFVQDVLAARRWRFGPLRPATAAILGLVALQALTSGILAVSFRSNQPQRASLEYVMAHTRPDDTVLDGNSGYGAFRPHAWYYFLLGTPIMNDHDVETFSERLRSGAVRPRVVIVDALVRGLPRDITAYVESHYSPVDEVPGAIWMRKTP